MQAYVGGNISMTCEIASLPPPLLLWQRNGGRITRGDVRMITNQRSMLTIQNAQYDVIGQYSCFAHNQLLQFSMNSRRASVTVQGKSALKNVCVTGPL